MIFLYFFMLICNAHNFLCKVFRCGKATIILFKLSWEIRNMNTWRSLENPPSTCSFSRCFVFSHYFFIQTLLKHSCLREFRSTTTRRCTATRRSSNSLLSNDAALPSETSKFLFPGRNVEQNASCQMEDPHAWHPHRKPASRRFEAACRWTLGRLLESFFWVTGARIVGKVTPHVPTCVCSVISNALARNTHSAPAKRKAEVSFPFLRKCLCEERTRRNERPTDPRLQT